MTGTAQAFALFASIPAFFMIVAMVRRGNLRVKYALLWIPVAISMIVFSIAPQLLDRLAGVVGVAYPPTVVFVLAIALLLFVTVHHSWELSRLDERVRTLAERIAIDRVETHG